MAAINAVGNSLTGLTGTGTFVGSNSPTIVTPIISGDLVLSTPAGAGVRFEYLNTDQTFAGSFQFQAGAGSANYGGGLIMYGASHASKPGYVVVGLSSSPASFFTVNSSGNGSGTDVFTVSKVGAVVANGSITPSSTGGIVGTTTNDSAAAGSVGQFLDAAVLIGAPVPLTNVTNANVTSIVLTPGDWDIGGNIAFTGDATTVCTSVIGALNTTSATLLDSAFTSATALAAGAVPFATGNVCMAIMGQQIQVATATTKTVYLIARAAFTVATCSAAGYVWARRRR